MTEQLKLDYLPTTNYKQHYGIGIYGSGFIVKGCHLPAYREAGYRVVGIASRTAANARSVAEEFDLPKAYNDLDELLDDPEVDVVDVAVPPHEQIHAVRRIADKGKHILAQKPLATHLAEAREIVDICEKAGVKLVVNQNGRFDPAVMAAKQFMRCGYLGKPVIATIELRFKPHWQTFIHDYDRLMFLNMSIHHLDQFRYLFGVPERIFAASAPDPTGQYRGEYIGSYILEYEHGPLASAWDDGYTWDPPGFGVFYKIEGTEGVVKLNVGWPSGGPSTMTCYSKQLGDQWHTPQLEGSWFPGAFRYTMGELFRSIDTGAESELSGRNNLPTMAMVEACYASCEQKRSIAISELLESGLNARSAPGSKAL